MSGNYREYLCLFPPPEDGEGEFPGLKGTGEVLTFASIKQKGSPIQNEN